MNEILYCIVDEKGQTIAQHMCISDAVIVAKALLIEKQSKEITIRQETVVMSQEWA